MLPVVLAAVHLLALVAGVSVLVLRAKALAAVERPEQLKRVFFWDNLYALVALFWLGSGAFRAFGGFEKGTDYYLGNHVFWTKMLLLLVLLSAESVALVAFVKARIRLARGDSVSLAKKALLIRLHWVELGAIFGMVLMAVLMARGVGGRPSAGAAGAAAGGAVEREALVAQGEAVYRVRCLVCHQADGRGAEGKLAADFVGDRSRLAKSDAALAHSIENGVPKTAMIGFGAQLSEQEIRAVIAYLRARFSQ
jgi:putative membrane protein